MEKKYKVHYCYLMGDNGKSEEVNYFDSLEDAAVFWAQTYWQDATIYIDDEPIRDIWGSFGYLKGGCTTLPMDIPNEKEMRKNFKLQERN